MRSAPLTLRRIFEQERRLVVPLFQRPYVWTQTEQWEPLWTDIETVANSVMVETQEKPAKPHFLGAVVLEEEPTATGQLDTRLIIDGQQRLTTLQLLLEAFRDFCKVAKLDNHAKGITKLTRNDDPMSTDEEDVFKVWPTVKDQSHFRSVMEAESPKALKTAYGIEEKKLSVGHPLADAYLFFHEQIAEWMSAPESNMTLRANALYSALRDKLRLVVIDLEPDDDAQVIFESLNARGTPLLPADLVKNFLFHQLRREGGDIEKIYEQEWKQFDSDDNYWRAEQGRGHARRARIDLFLQNYLAARKAAEVPTAHLFTVFREYVLAGGTTMEHLQAIRRYAAIYRSFESQPANSREALFFSRIWSMEMASVYPFILELFASFREMPEQKIGVLVDLESFLVRRMVCGLSTRGYSRIFVELLKVLPGDAKSVRDRVRAALLQNTAASNRWPDEKEFSAEWRQRRLFEVLTQQRLRLVLEAIERSLWTNKTPVVAFTEGLTIEHLLPQNWTENWPLPADVDPKEATELRNMRLHSIGNLTLLTGPLNSSVSNGAWSAKQAEILKYCAFSLNRTLPKTWDEATIAARSEELFARARNIWPHPGDEV